MQLTAKVKLQVTPQQASTLKRTLQAANECCNWLSDMAWSEKKFGQFSLHKIAYHPARSKFPGLNSSVIVRCEAKVSQSYALDKRIKRTFKPLGAIEYDHNILSWYVDKRQVSIWTVAGRLRLTFACGPRQLELLQGKIGQADLALVGKNFYLCAPCTVENPEPQDVSDVLGVDLGIVNIATDSDGLTHSGVAVEDNRRKFEHRRRNLQRKGTQSSKRKLRKLSGKQARFQRNTNHVISKRVVRKAQDTGRGIGLEDLTGIRNRATTRRSQRARISNWSFFELRVFIEYKAQREGVPVFLVDPKNTSRTCPRCGCIDKANRKSQSVFSCISCAYADNADHNAAVNIAARAKVTRPMVGQFIAPTSSLDLLGSM